MPSARIEMQLHHHVHFQIEIARQKTCADWNIDHHNNGRQESHSAWVRGSKYVIIWPWAENKYRTQLADIHVGQTTRVRKSKHSKEQTPKKKKEIEYGNVTL